MNRYARGWPVDLATLDKCISHGCWMWLHRRPIHPSFLDSMQHRTLRRLCDKKQIRFAIPNSRVLVFRGIANWIAMCLDYDIPAQAEELDGLGLRLDLALRAELFFSLDRDHKPFLRLPAAPTEYHDAWHGKDSRRFQVSDDWPLKSVRLYDGDYFANGNAKWMNREDGNAQHL